MDLRLPVFARPVFEALSGAFLVAVILIAATVVLAHKCRPGTFRWLLLAFGIAASCVVSVAVLNVQTELVVQGDSIVIKRLLFGDTVVPISTVEALQESINRAGPTLLIKTSSGDSIEVKARAEFLKQMELNLPDRLGLVPQPVGGRKNWVRK